MIHFYRAIFHFISFSLRDFDQRPGPNRKAKLMPLWTSHEKAILKCPYIYFETGYTHDKKRHIQVVERQLCETQTFLSSLEHVALVSA